MNNFTCRVCRNDKLQLSNMKRESGLLANNRGICKPCVSIYETNRKYEFMARNKPESMLSCNGCDRLFYKYQSGPRLSDGTRLLRTSCPHCKCDDIEKVY